MYHALKLLGTDPLSREGRFFNVLSRRLLQDIYTAPPGAKVLDASCAIPHLLMQIAESESQHVVHIAASMESDARIARFMIPGADIQLCRASNLPWKSELFDSIIYAECLECLVPAEVSGTLSELRRVLKPGGTLTLATASVRMGNTDINHRQHFTPESLDRMLGQFFESRTIEGFGKERAVLWSAFESIFDNSLFEIKPVRRWYNKMVWPRYVAKCRAEEGVRLIAVCKK